MHTTSGPSNECRSRVTPLLSAPGRSLAIAAALAVAGGCGGCTGQAPPVHFHFTFDEDLEGWSIGFADYPVGASDAEQQAIDDFFELGGGHTGLPEPLDTGDGALRLTGNNHSDDLFMFIKRRVRGLVPDSTYQLELRVVFASNVPTGCAGIGGSPGESVFVKGGATAAEPLRVIDDSAGQATWTMNVDKGFQSEPGADAQVLGTFGNGRDCASSDFSYALKQVSNLELPAFTVTADGEGTAWLLLGTDSGFEGTTTIYYTEIEAIFMRLPETFPGRTGYEPQSEQLRTGP